MWQQGKKFWGSFPFIITTAAFATGALAAGMNIGWEAVLYIAALFVFSVMIVARTYHESVAQRVYYETKLSSMRSDHQLASVFEGARTGYWFHKYLEVREDRAAFLKVLTTVFPAGYREEYYAVQSPTDIKDYGLSQALQWFLYIDLPEEYGLEFNQIRLAVSEQEKQIIGDLPDYNDQRITLLEADARASMRQYLVTEAVNHLKEQQDASDGQAVAA